MCHPSCIEFGKEVLSEEEIKNKLIIEVGAQDVGGSLRSTIEAFNPAKYLGVDIVMGKGVDKVCHAENLIKEFGEESFDVVISTELLEHVKEWRKVISNMKNICRTNGIILITTRSPSFGYHAYPNDYWRYTLDNMRNIFSDCKILSLISDPLLPGVFIKVKKPEDFKENNLESYAVHTVTK